MRTRSPAAGAADAGIRSGHAVRGLPRRILDPFALKWLRQNHQRRSQEFELLGDFVATYGIAAQSSI